MTGPNPAPELPICPKGWTIKWRKIRKKSRLGRKKKIMGAGLLLRHTYASYHAKHFKDYNLLQMEMGHRSSSLLRTRYLNMKGISPQTATRFWALTPAKVIEETKPPEEPPVS